VREDSVDVFVSYAREEADQATAIRGILEHEGISCWMDSQLESGYWPEQLARRIRFARQFVLLGSSAAYKSSWVRREAQAAADRPGDFVHHVIIERADVPEWLSFLFGDRQRIDASGPDGLTIIESRLVPAIKSRLALNVAEAQAAERLRNLGLVPAEIIDGIDRLGMASSGYLFHASLMDPAHRERIAAFHAVDSERGERLIAAIDPSERRDGTSSVAFTSTRLSWHELQPPSAINQLRWDDIRSARATDREFDGSWTIDIRGMSDRRHSLRLHCQTDAFAHRAANLIESVAHCACPSSPPVRRA
jgi:hypothetical protein